MRLFLTHQVARVLNCTPDNVRILARTGKLRALRAGSMRVFREADVERLRQERERTSQRARDCWR